MEFNWEEFKVSNNIAVHCKTEEEAIDFCNQMNEHGMEWNNGESYLDETNWNGSRYNEGYKEETCYEADGSYANVEYYGEGNYKILEWSNYMNEEKENRMNLELNNLTDEQKKQIIELAKKFEQENEVDKLDKRTDYRAIGNGTTLDRVVGMSDQYAQDHFALGLTAHTKEEAEKIRRRLLVEKELRDWAKKCKKPLEIEKLDTGKYVLAYNIESNTVYAESYYSHLFGGILFSEERVAKQAIESIGQERLIRDYFGIEREEK